MKNPKVLVSPLDWGLGHATRCIPVIRQLQESGFEVFIGGYGASFTLLKLEFPGVESFTIPGFRVRLSKSDRLWMRSILHLPAFFISLYLENRQIKQILKKHSISILISDNRYGIFASNTYNILITHQLNPLTPKGLGSMRLSIKKLIEFLCKPYQEVWIPDFPGQDNLTGELSEFKVTMRNLPKYIGPLSRFNLESCAELPASEYDILVLASGPEPQRHIFEKAILQQFSSGPYRTLVICGKPGTRATFSKEVTGKNGSFVTILPHLSTDLLLLHIKSVPLIISRSGYTTIMDLMSIGRTALFIPTPGQPEQEYLGKRMKEAGLFQCIRQEEISELEVHIDKSPDPKVRFRTKNSNWQFIPENPDPVNFKIHSRLEELIQKLWEKHHHHKVNDETGKVS